MVGRTSRYVRRSRGLEGSVPFLAFAVAVTRSPFTDAFAVVCTGMEWRTAGQRQRTGLLLYVRRCCREVLEGERTYEQVMNIVVNRL